MSSACSSVPPVLGSKARSSFVAADRPTTARITVPGSGERHHQHPPGDRSRALSVFRDIGHPRYTALSLALVAVTYTGRPADYERALAMCAEAIDLAQRVGEQQLLAQTLNAKGRDRAAAR